MWAYTMRYHSAEAWTEVLHHAWIMNGMTQGIEAWWWGRTMKAVSREGYIAAVKRDDAQDALVMEVN